MSAKISKTNIVILTTNLIRTNGGTYACFQIIDSACRAGLNVTVALRGQTKSNYIKYFQEKYKLNIGDRNLINARYLQFSHRLDSVARKFIGGSSRVLSIYEVLSKIILSIVGIFCSVIDKKFEDALQSADIVFVNEIFDNEKNIKYLKNKTSAKIIGTHYAPVGFNMIGLATKYSSVDPVIKYKSFYGKYDALLFESISEAKKFDDLFEKAKSLCIMPVIDELSFRDINQRPSSFDSNFFNIAVVCSIQHRKGIHKLLEVVKILTEYNENILCHVVGPISDVGYYGDLIYLIDLFKIRNNIRFYGERSDYLSFIKFADIVVQTSIAEGVSTVLREAMFLKKAIVTFAISGTTDLLTSGLDSILVPPFDALVFAQNIKELINDSEKISQLGSNAYKTYKEKCSKDNHVQFLKQGFQDVIARNLCVDAVQ